jgi:NmrA-like family protein
MMIGIMQDTTKEKDELEVGDHLFLFLKRIVLTKPAFLKSQDTKLMAWTNVLSGPYMETLLEIFTPKPDADGIYVFDLPLHDGAIPFIALDDLARYVLWAFYNPKLSNGLTIGAATEHASGPTIAEAFTAATGKPARYHDISVEQWLEKIFGATADRKIGEEHAPGDQSLMTYRQNFTAWWELYRASGGNKGIITRDYTFLDKILPNRISSVEGWMKLTGYDGTAKSIIKTRAEREK